jgi:hypothetical protein
MSDLVVDRRSFLQSAVGAGVSLAASQTTRAAEPAKMIGIQVGAVSFVDEGTEKVLDILQERGAASPEDRSPASLYRITASRSTISSSTAATLQRPTRSTTRTRCSRTPGLLTTAVSTFSPRCCLRPGSAV